MRIYTNFILSLLAVSSYCSLSRTNWEWQRDEDPTAFDVHYGKRRASLTSQLIWSRTNSAKVALQFHGYYYTVDVSVGTPAQNFSTIVSTATTAMWVVASECTICDQNRSHTYNFWDSGTSREVGQHVTISFMLNSVEGDVIQDVVRTSFPSICQKNGNTLILSNICLTFKHPKILLIVQMQNPGREFF